MCAQSCNCFLSFLMWILGGIILGTMMWILGTSSNSKTFFTGTMVFTYVVLVIGSLLFINGILGWISSLSEGGCLFMVYLIFSVITISAEIFGIIALNIMKTKMSDVLQKAWVEVNQASRNVIQEHFDCCGFIGPEEFVDNTEPIHDTCYIPSSPDGYNELHVVPSRSLNRMGCKEKLVDWFYTNKLIWISSLGCFLLLQVIVALLTVYVINRRKQSRRSTSNNDIHYHTRL